VTSAGEPNPAPRITRVGSGERYVGTQGLEYRRGVTRDTVGARTVCMTVLEIPPGARSKAHFHRGIETVIYVIAGEAETWAGDGLEQRVVAGAGDYLHIPGDVPHVVVNRGAVPCRAVVVHASSDDQDGIVLVPALDAMVP